MCGCWVYGCLFGWLVVGCLALGVSEARGSGFGGPKDDPKTDQDGPRLVICMSVLSVGFPLKCLECPHDGAQGDPILLIALSAMIRT